jgi:uncharacterized protein YbjT (DUF2867 family)
MAVISSLIIKKEDVRALVHSKVNESALKELGVKEIAAGDMTDMDFMNEASKGVRAVYHIGPSASPDESRMGTIAINAAKSSGVARFVFHSVLHPQIPQLTHHRQKLMVEEELINSGLEFTVLQPASYMQNILPGLETIKKTGVHSMPYAAGTRTSLVDLDEVGEVAAKVLTEKGHDGATYELCSGEYLSVTGIARILSEHLNIPVRAEAVPVAVWIERARGSGLSEYSAAVLARMFGYYEKFGFRGNPNVMAWLLGRTPNTYSDFLKNNLKK